MKNNFIKLRKLHGYIHEFLLQKYRQICNIYNNYYLKSLQNKYAGKRCFIIGNGPSLNVCDLDKLKTEYTFGTHRIYNIFKQTDWRPTFYCAQDQKLIRNSHKEINNLIKSKKFIAFVHEDIKNITKNAKYIKIVPDEFYPSLPNFSTDITKQIYEGYTVSYMCLQLAVYMGFNEIYLLGIDHNYTITQNPDGSINNNTSVKSNYFCPDSECRIENIPHLFNSTLAYQAAKEYAEKNDIKIINLTRGGNLEVFERADFDSIIH